jgi:hypothetical protein
MSATRCDGLISLARSWISSVGAMLKHTKNAPKAVASTSAPSACHAAAGGGSSPLTREPPSARNAFPSAAPMLSGTVCNAMSRAHCSGGSSGPSRARLTITTSPPTAPTASACTVSSRSTENRCRSGASRKPDMCESAKTATKASPRKRSSWPASRYVPMFHVSCVYRRGIPKRNAPPNARAKVSSSRPHPAGSLR